MPDLQVFNLFNSTPYNPDCAPERTGELMLSWETMLTFESIWLVDTSQFSRMPHCKTNSFCKFGGLSPLLWMKFPKVLPFSAFFIFDKVKNLLSYGAVAPLSSCRLGRTEYEPLLLEHRLVFCATAGSSEGSYSPKRADGWLPLFLTPIVAIQHVPAKPVLFVYSQYPQQIKPLEEKWLCRDLGGWLWALLFESVGSLSKSQLCCSRSIFDYSVKHWPFDIMVRKACTQPSRFHSIPPGRIQGYSTSTHIGRDNWYKYMCLCFPTHVPRVTGQRWICLH